MKQRASLVQNMASNGRVRPFSQIRDVIREELLEPRSAFVSTQIFDSDWKIFEEVSRVLRIRFAHSEHSEDFGNIFDYQLTGGFNEHVGNAMRLGAEMLMESGIFGLRRKWEKLRQVFKRPNKTVVEKAFVELSFYNSDVHLVFGVYAAGIVVATLHLGAEYV